MKRLVSTFIFLGILNFVFAQNTDSLILHEDIKVLARSSADSITLRWAPATFETWSAGNRSGYLIERHTLVRNNVVIVPESKVLTLGSLVPQPLDNWKGIVSTDKYAAIAAQALFGDEFSVEMESSGPVTIANKVRENEQRFSLALLSADISPRVAKMSALWFTDTTVRVGEKYLYRILIKSNEKIYRGSVFVNPADTLTIFPPRNLQSNVRGRSVELKWLAEERMRFTGFRVERSMDSVVFESVGNILNVTLSPSRDASIKFNYASDSIPPGVDRCYYRVIGITPFGEESRASNTVVATDASLQLAIPRILDARSEDNSTIDISWDFPPELNQNLRGFMVERGTNDRNMKAVHDFLIAPSERRVTDENPLTVNYYRVVMLAKSGEKFFSFPFLATLVDSIPPNAPQGLKAVVDHNGKLNLEWEQNSENDLYGYRVYKSNHRDEEGFQLTAKPILTNSIIDQIDLNNLTKTVFYTVAAVDKNQNQSGLSFKLKVKLPDKLRPMPPNILPCENDSSAVKVRWVKSSSVDVEHYEVYRSETKNGHAVRLKVVPATSDTLAFVDEIGQVDLAYRYNVIAIDSSGNQSMPSGSVIGMRVDGAIPPAVSWKNSVVNESDKTVLLKWEYGESDVSNFKIYKNSNEGNGFSLYKTIAADRMHFVDRLSQKQVQRYRIIAVLNDGRKSKLSEQLEIQF